MSLGFGRLNAMIVDDNAQMRYLVRDILNSFGVGTIVDVADGASAMAEMQNIAIDVAFVDLMMEPIDGIEFVRLIRRSKDSPNIFLPIVMLTGHTMRSRIIEARDAGVTEFLAKPVSPTAVYKRLQAIIEKPRVFVRNASFVGPDRRRRTEPFHGEPKRFDDVRTDDDQE